jgi:hypothetical protein
MNRTRFAFLSEGLANCGTANPQSTENSEMMRPVPPALFTIPADLGDMIREFAETGMKDLVTRVLLERAREWQAAESTLSSKSDQSVSLPDVDAEDPDDVSTTFLAYMFHSLTAWSPLFSAVHCRSRCYDSGYSCSTQDRHLP